MKKYGFLCFFYCCFLATSLAQFRLLSPAQTGISFTNQLTETEKHNVLAYEYFYNGGGVGVGDFNNDGLLDLYFTGNMVEDKLYLNQGKLIFKDITLQAGIHSKVGWKTGVTLVDINQDGWLDIYVSYSGDGDANARRNKLYVNQHNLTFLEQAAVYQLDLPTNTTQSAFFDYDKDGDLDCFLLNHSIKDYKRFDAAALKAQRDETAGDRLLRNDNGKFIDVSEQAHIKGNPLGFGLGVAVADLNQDGWCDIYVSNDYIEQDYMYINNGDGTFTDKLETALGHLSQFSMGNEIADINNDGLPDIITLDMLPEDNRRQKLLYGPENYENYQSMIRNGFYHQLMRNMLQLNNGDGTFSEIGQLAGISNTDWSWCPLVADFDNDGYKDIFITNGYLRDYTNMDFMKFYADKELKAALGSPTAMMDILKEMPSTATKNYVFRNNGKLQFENKTKEWHCDELFLSNGAVYADLDNDGALEIVTNNVNQPAAIYKNENLTKQHHYIQIQLADSYKATNYGAKAWVYTQGKMQFREFYPTRGFQSSMMTPLHFGVGEQAMIDSVKIQWSNGLTQVVHKLNANQTFIASIDKNAKKDTRNAIASPSFQKITNDTLPYSHVANWENDFKRQLLLPNMLSYNNPKVATGDLNGDGTTDIFIGGSKGQSAAVLFRKKDGSWYPSAQPALEADLMRTDTQICLFDVDKDGDLDAYVVGGGYAYLSDDLLLQDRLYLNDGKGFFTKATDNLITGDVNSDGCATVLDFDHDGDFDIFVGGHVIPGNYPLHAPSRLLQNDGKGVFSDVTTNALLIATKLGILNAARTLDVNQDGWDDLVVAGDWTGVQVLLNHKGIFDTQENIAEGQLGWWSAMTLADLDKDGDEDIIVGNYGLNNQLKPTPTTPVTLVYADFDNNEAIDPFVSYFIGNQSYPLVNREEALNQVFALRRKFPTYASYAQAGIQDMFSLEQLQKASTLTATSFETIVLENKGNNHFTVHQLPIEAQFAPVFAIALMDVNKDGKNDLILAGNQSHTRIKIGKIDANYGTVLLNKGNFSFEFMPFSQVGFQLKGDIRDVWTEGNQIHFFGNNASPSSFQLKK